MSSRAPVPSALLRDVERRAAAGAGASPAEALKIARQSDLGELMESAGRVRRAHFGNGAQCCSIVNVKSGRCTEDCKFCAQSAHYSEFPPRSPMLDEGAVRAAAREARRVGAAGLGLVAAGCRPSDGELEEYCGLLRAAGAEGVTAHASLGLLEEPGARRLAAAGVSVYNHNLETARSYFREICTTHEYDQRLATLEAARAAGMQRCCGGIFGMGESWEQRVELGAELARLEVERVPVNFLHPIAGTPLGDRERLSAEDALRIIAVLRIILPRAMIQVCGGRELILGPRQAELFAAGATGVILGNYLTTAGRPVEEDLAMLGELGLELVG
jgi:biotin synthase